MKENHFVRTACVVSSLAWAMVRRDSHLLRCLEEELYGIMVYTQVLSPVRFQGYQADIPMVDM